jgi:hypothetical protein
VRERGLLAAGLGVNALAFRDVPIVNAWLVGVSADSVWPDERLYYARIRTPEALMTAGASLDVLGIRYVLARREERVASGLRAGPVIATSRHELVLYENADAWSGAFLLDPEEAAGELPRHPGCENDRVLCLDLAPLAARARRELVNAHRTGGAIDISMPRLDQPAVLVVTEMFRPGWQARSSVGALTTGRFAGGLLRVDVPAGLTAVRLLYRPPLMIASTIVAWSALAASAFLLARRAAATGRRMLFDAGDRLEVDET